MRSVSGPLGWLSSAHFVVYLKLDESTQESGASNVNVRDESVLYDPVSLVRHNPPDCIAII